MLWQPLNLTEACPAHTHVSACSHFGYVYLNLLVQLFGDSKDRRINEQVHNDCEKQHKDRIVDSVKGYKKEYDFVVVGAGSAGCVVANRLSAIKEWKVLLLEAGSEQPDITLVPALAGTIPRSSVDWKYRTQPDEKSCLTGDQGGCEWPRGKTMGGSSSMNSMVYVRGNKRDYDKWAELGNVGWSYRDVLPYFKKSERNLNIEFLDRKYHGVNGEQFVSRFPYVDGPTIMTTEGYNQIGLPILDFNGAQQEGAMVSQAVSREGERVSSNNAFIEPIRNERDNLEVITEAEAVKLLFDENKRAYGVVYVKDGEFYIATAKKEVIVSGGAINSPKLLMVSGVGPKDQLENLGIPVIADLAVGKNLHDHVTFTGIVIRLSNKTATTVSNDEIIRSVHDYHDAKIKRGPLSSVGPEVSIAFVKTGPCLEKPDIQFQINPIMWEEFVQEPSTMITVLPKAFYSGLIAKAINIDPKSRGDITLNTTDPNGPPIIQPNYFGDERDLVTLKKGVNILRKLGETEAFKSCGAYFVKTPLKGCEDYEWESDDYTECLARHYTTTSYHPVGTCKMGPASDRKAVVDPRLRVYDVFGLRVIDASIMPIAPGGNTNAPSIMVGERGVALVLEDWLQNYCH